ncbi:MULTISPECIES: hypothetical protein [unclassified Blastococcus]
MPRRPAPRLALVLLAGALTAGCTSVVAGTPAPGGGFRTDATDAELTVGLAGDGEVDRLARNTMADVVTYWQETLPAVYGEQFTPPEGGYWSVDPATTDDADLPRDACVDVDYVAMTSALYCPDTDTILYNAGGLADSMAAIGPLVVGSTMAHEMGHAIQHRVGTADRETSLVLETQAECFAGSWSRWVADGGGSHSVVRAAELDLYLEGYAFFGDPAGSSPEDPGAHGSAYDQLAAFLVGWDGGAQACREEFTADRLFVIAEFTSEEEADSGGDVPLREALTAAEALLDAFWTAAADGDLAGDDGWRGDVATPAVTGELPATCDVPAGGLRLSWCVDDGGRATVVADEEVLAPASAQLGDFAVVALLGLPWALAAREQLGLPVRGPEALASAGCTVGWMTGLVLAGDLPGQDLRLSPGDVDEAALVLLDAAEDPALVPAPELPATALVDAFRRGFESLGEDCAA